MHLEELAEMVERGWKIKLVRLEKSVTEHGELIRYTKEIDDSNVKDK